MDFELSDEQQAISDLAGQILSAELTHERLRAIGEGALAERAWQELARAGLVGIALPIAHGGAGLGMLEACLVLEQVGRTVAPVPYLATVVLGARPIAAFGTPEQQSTFLSGVIDGAVTLTAALSELGNRGVPLMPATAAESDGDGWRITGEKHFVPWADGAERILVPAATGEGTSAVFLVDPAAAGVQLEALLTTSGEPQSVLLLDGVRVGAGDRVGSEGQGAEVVARIVDEATAGVCSTAAGLCLEALAMTGRYTSERHQFNAPIATFQAVAQRAADAYIDAHGVFLTSRQAAWRLGVGLSAEDELDIAKFWAAEGAQRVVHAAQHLHGGIGVDKDYPLHRYFLMAKVLELTFGGATDRLRALGARIAEGAVRGEASGAG